MTEERPITIDAHGVSKTYGKGQLAVHALRDVDFVARAGELVILAGPSGSGKSTLLSILGCVLTPSAGEVRLLGERVDGRPERELPNLRLTYIGFVFQAHNLITSLTATENVVVPLRLRRHPARAARAEARELLARVGLHAEADRSPDTLSMGQRQRVAIARALAGAPPILLADEPTASLDAETGHEVVELLRSLCVERGRTAVVVTHDARIFPLADRLVRIDDGRIVGGDR
jgi:putative ABC transport system ATP-binding protein